MRPRPTVPPASGASPQESRTVRPSASRPCPPVHGRWAEAAPDGVRVEQVGHLALAVPAPRPVAPLLGAEDPPPSPPPLCRSDDRPAVVARDFRETPLAARGRALARWRLFVRAADARLCKRGRRVTPTPLLRNTPRSIGQREEPLWMLTASRHALNLVFVFQRRPEAHGTTPDPRLP